MGRARHIVRPGPHVKARHGGGHAAGPISNERYTFLMATTTFPTRDDFAALLNESLGGENETFEGKVVKGTVTAIENDMAVIDVGLKSEGRVPLREFAAPGQKAELNVGDEVEVYVDRVENSAGEAMLSRDRARREAAWDKLEKEFEAGNRVEGVIFGRVKGGFTVDLGGAVAFLPGSQVDIRPVRDVGPLMDLPQPFQILKMDRRRGNIVVSRRAILEETRAEQRSGLIQSLAEGQVIEGVVKNITDYGAFVDLGGIDGLLHVTDVSYKRVNHPSEVLNIGDTVKVQIIRINKDTQRISLGMKQLESDPWEGATRQISDRRHVPRPGDQHHRIWRLRGARAGHRRPGPRFRDELDQEERPPGQDRQHRQEVDVKVLEVDEEKRRISLGLKQAQENPWAAFAETHPVGSTVEGEVKNATEFGLFVGLEGDVDGMVHMSDIAWGVSGEEALQLHRKGETVKAQVLDVDVEKERISLGMKQLEKRRRGRRREQLRGGGGAQHGRRRQEGRSSHRDRARGPGRRARRPGRRRWRDRLRQAHRPWPRPRRAARRALPGRPEVRCDGHRLRPLEKAELLDQGDADRRGEAGGGAVRQLGFGRVARRHPRRGAQGKGRCIGWRREARQEEEVTGKAASPCGDASRDAA